MNRQHSLEPGNRAEAYEMQQVLEDYRFSVARHLYDRLHPGKNRQIVLNDIAPSKLGARILPNIYMLDVSDNGTDFKWRLHGSSLEEKFGQDLTGSKISVIAEKDPGFEDFLSIAKSVYAQKKALCYSLGYANKSGLPRVEYGILVPVLDNDNSVIRLIGCAQVQ